MRAILSFSLAVAASAGLLAQSPAFEVATVKANRSGSGSSNGPFISKGRLAAQNASLRQILQVAYGVSELEISGPDWLNYERFDLAGKVPDGVPDTEIMPMLQSLLKDRFRLAAHDEERETAVYDLTVAKGGAKLTAFDPSHIPATPPRNGAESMIIGPMTMSQLASQLARPAGRPVIDKTGLEGRYFLAVTFSPLSADPREGAVDIFAALQQQLGLRLEPDKEKLRILVVDHAERVPLEN